jgi:Flp pilus assembly protein TadG
MIRRIPSSPGSKGSISVELAILLPTFMSLIMLAAMLGRLTVDQTSVDLAAHDAARAASLSRTGIGADKAAQAAAKTTLDPSTCTSPLIVKLDDPDVFKVPIGQPATVTYDVTCKVPLKDLAFLYLPDSVTLTARFTSPLDTFRIRSPS